MSWFSSSRYPAFEEKVNEATSESIPNGDIDFATALEVSDMIRSKQVPPKESMRSLKKRFMDAENINIQKSAFKLIDFCIKNGGSHFIKEIASKEFMDPLVALLRNKEIDENLKVYLLENIQTWSIMVSTDSKYEYINQCYKKLQDDGFEFPVINDVVDVTMIDSKVAPEWQDSDACMICSRMFTFLVRKHHCRACGGVFCAQHSCKSIELPEFGINIPVRVCDNCYADRKAKAKKSKHSKKSSLDKSKRHHTSMEDNEDDAIQKAIELSLKDVSAPTSTSNTMVTKNYGDVDDEEDEAMKAAIAASLQDLNKTNNINPDPVNSGPINEEPVDTSTGLYSNLLSNNSYIPSSTSTEIAQQNIQRQPYIEQQQQPLPPIPEPQTHPLTQQPTTVEFQPPVQSISNSIRGIDEQKVVDFVDLLDKQKNSNAQSLDPRLIQLHSDMVLFHPKIAAAIVDEHSQIDKFQSLYSKLFVIGRLYDDILQNRLKQEQEMLKAQYTNPNPPFAGAYNPTGYRQPDPNQYMSPQVTVGQQPTVHQLQAYPPPTPLYNSQQHHSAQLPLNISSQATYSTPPAYASIPTSYAVPENLVSQQPPQQQQQFQQPQPTTQSNIPASNLVPSSPYTDKLSTVEVDLKSKLPSLDSISYAPIPVNPTSESTPTEPTKAEPVSESYTPPTIKKEPEVVNLIDL